MSTETRSEAVVPRPTYSVARRTIATYLASVLLSAAAMTWVLRLWRADLRVPFFYLVNDATAVAAHFKTVIETGWYEAQPALGAPAGQVYHDFPTADNLHFMAADVLSLFTSNYAVAMNIYYLVGFPLAAVTATYFFREVGVSRYLTVPLSVLYAVAPYHLLRNEMHLWLASYYPVPLAMVVVLRILRGHPVWGIRRLAPDRLIRLPAGARRPVAMVLAVISGRGAVTALILALVATASTYYAVFTLLLLAASGLVQLARTGDRRRFVGAVVAGVAIVVVVGANMLPDFLYAWTHGANLAALSRQGAASEDYALKIASLLLPAPGHPIELLAGFRAGYDTNYPVPSESPALGSVAAIGLLILLVMTVEFVANRVRNRAEPDRVRRTRELLRQLAALVLVSLLCSSVGGLATFISFISRNIRGWNRMSILIMLFCLAAVGVVLDAWLSRRAERQVAQRAERQPPAQYPRARRPVRWTAAIVATTVLVVGVADQSLTGGVPDYAGNAVAHNSDRAFVTAIEAQVPVAAMIFQLPNVEFPESPPVNGVTDGDQLRLYLSSTTLRWSGGGLRGRPQSDWPVVVTEQGTEVIVRSLATIGFAGIVTDRKRAGAAADSLEDGLIPYTGPATAVSPDGRYAYFSLSAPRALLAQSRSAEQLRADAALVTNPVMAYPGSQFNWTDREVDGNGYRLWTSGQSTGDIPVVNNRGVAATVTLDVQLAGVGGARDVQVTVGGESAVVTLAPEMAAPDTDSVIQRDPEFVEFRQQIQVPAGDSVITLSPGPQTLAEGGADDVRYVFHHLLLLDS